MNALIRRYRGTFSRKREKALPPNAGRRISALSRLRARVARSAG